MNRFLPRTFGAKISLDALTYIVEKDEPVIEPQPPKIGEVERRIGENVAQQRAEALIAISHPDFRDMLRAPRPT